jgi:hypothetical protein
VGDFIACALFMSIFLFVAYVYGRSYLIDAKASERFPAQEKLCLSVCFLACCFIGQGIRQNRGLPSQFSAYIFLAVAGLIAWGSYRLARRAIIQQFVATQKLGSVSDKERIEVSTRPSNSAETNNSDA